MKRLRGSGRLATGFLVCMALGACAESQTKTGGPVTAEDWLRVDRELMREKTPAPEAVTSPETAAPQEALAGRILPPSKIEAPPMPTLPPPEVEEKGTIPAVAESIETRLPKGELPAATPSRRAEASPPTASEIPAPPPLIAAPEPAESPPAAAPPGIELVPKEFTLRPVIPAAPRLPDPAKLKGFEPAAMQALLGVPDLLRWENHAQVYQYRGSECVLDIIFYESPSGGPFQAVHLSARGPGGQDTEVKACLVDLLPAESWPDTLLN